MGGVGFKATFILKIQVDICYIYTICWKYSEILSQVPVTNLEENKA